MSAPHQDGLDDAPELLDAEDALEEVVDAEGDIAMDSDEEESEEITLHNDSIAYFDAHKDSVFTIAQHPTQPSLIATGGGFTKADVEAIADLKLKGGALASLAGQGAFQGRFEYHTGKRPWQLLPKVHIALPCATQNEVSAEDAEALIKTGVKIVVEGSNMVRRFVFLHGLCC